MLEVIDSVPAHTLEKGDVISHNGSEVEIVEVSDLVTKVYVITENDDEIEFVDNDLVNIYG